MIKRIILPLFFLLCLLRAGFAFSEQPDTIVVYEYIYKTDTVWVESAPTRDTIVLYPLNPIENATLIIDTTGMKANLVIFSTQGSATIPINNIILSENNQN